MQEGVNFYQKGNKMWIKCVWYDVKTGCLSQWKKYLAVAMFTGFSCLIFYIRYQHKLQLEHLYFGDYLFWNFRGMSIIIQKNKFLIPNGYWIALNMFLAIIVGDFPVQQLKGVGQQVILRMKKRSHWWFSKCVWCVVCVILYYMVILSVIFIISLLMGKMGCAHIEVVENFSKTTVLEKITTNGFLFNIFLMILTSIAVSLMQLVLSVWLSSIIGYIFVAGILVVAMESVNSYVIGNYLMMIRMYSGKIVGQTGVIIDLLLMISAILLGGYVIYKKDISKKTVD